jgi:hypothetical protein
MYKRGTTMKIIKKFLEHPNSIGETYTKHMWNAFKMSVKLNFLAFLLLLHAFIPFIFETKVSSEIIKLSKEMETRKKILYNLD